MSSDPVDAFYAAYNLHDAAAAAALYREDGWHEEAHNGARRQGREALAAGLDRFFGFLAEAHWQPRERIDAGPNVAVVYTLTGTLAVDLKGKPTRGLPITLGGVHVFELADGAVAGTRDYWDPAAFQRQIEAVA
ncbi:nuclear transport factor 2 family protein [Ancylobacter oerskovii]|uniref:Nuclear transport factor 2 family protein n=1 Tax=Ancylobacter oerskovii TaxID=459519 RepID=A0ABW4YVK9_9HYPH|nr:nuclear transport factor 2 family protein [Ancylobacter oerskovii]MBS7543101.1 nuclear transport factor 2 family protein [Ancylobacter oerskovii]